MKHFGKTVNIDRIYEIKEKIQLYNSNAREMIELRDECTKSMLCRWSNQHIDGTVHAIDGHTDAFPFVGSSDQCVRLTDKIINDEVALYLNALVRCTVEIKATSGNDKLARHLTVILNWMRKRMGANFILQMGSAIRFMLNDSPSISMVSIQWISRPIIGVRVVNKEDILHWLRLQTDGDKEARDRLGKPQDNQTDLLEYTNVLESIYYCPGEYAQDVAEEIYDNEEASFMAHIGVEERPDIISLRYADEFVLPTLCEDFSMANPWFLNRWITVEELFAMADENDFNEEWVEETKDSSGQAYMNDTPSSEDAEDRKGMVNIVWVYFVEVDENGSVIRYYTLLSVADGCAFDPKPVQGCRGEWPAQLFTREICGSQLVNGRGLAEIIAPHQGIIKKLRDSITSNALVGTLPPIVAKGSRIRNLQVAPLRQITIDRNDSLNFLNPPAYPAAGINLEDKIENEIKEYFGLQTQNGDPETANNLKRAKINFFLLQVRDLFMKLLYMAQDCASDSLLTEITKDTNADGIRRRDIDGGFTLDIKLNVDDLNIDTTIKKANSLGLIVQTLDRSKTFDTYPALVSLIRSLMPEISEESMRDPNQMSSSEIEEEEGNFIKIKAGIMPKINADGNWNYATRLAYYQRLQEENPQALQDMTPASQQMLQQWLQALTQQDRQYGVNADIGRSGVDGVEVKA